MTLKPYILQGEERDEIEAMVMRIKTADSKVQQKAVAPISGEDETWAEANKLPRAFFEFFEIQRA